MQFSDRRSIWKEVVLVTLLFSALTFVLAYPLSLHPASTLFPFGADTDLMLWILGWDVHAFTHQPLSIFDANIYYPYHHTLAYAENLIGTALLVAPVVWLTGNLVLALNVATLLSCVLCGLGTYVLARRLGIGTLGAVVGGLIFAFAPPRFFRIGQIHLTTVQWIPFCLAFLHGYLETGQKRDLRIACALFTLQVLTSAHGGVFLTLAVVALIAWRVVLGEPLMFAKRLRDLGISSALVLSLNVLVFLPYRAVQHEMGLKRSVGEAYGFSPTASSFIASTTHVHAFLLSAITHAPILQTATALLFPGYATLVLALVGLSTIFAKAPPRPPRERATIWRWVAWIVELVLVVSLVVATAVTIQGGGRLRYGSAVLLSAKHPWRVWLDCAILTVLRVALIPRAPLDFGPRWRRFRNRYRQWSDRYRGRAVTFYSVLTLISIWLALGPQFGLYGLALDLPGFNFIRVPSRFTIVALLGLAVLAAAGFERWTARFAPRTRTTLGIVTAAVLVAEFAAMPLSLIPFRIDIPSIDRWLATQSKPFVVAELPAWERWNAWYMLHSMAHWQKTIHGYSGLEPPINSRLFDELETFPDDQSVASLANVGVNYVVIHTGLYPPQEWSAIETRLAGFTEWLTLEHVEADGRAYSLHRPLVSPGIDGQTLGGDHRE